MDGQQEVVEQKNPEIRARTFQEAKALPKGFSDTTILGLINNDLVGVDGKPVYFFKSYLDEVKPDAEDQALSKSPEGLAQFHSAVVDMIAANLRVATGNMSEEEKKYVSEYKRRYVQRLQKDSVSWADLIKEYSNGESKGLDPKLGEYWGFKIGSKEGNVDISSHDVPAKSNIRPNIRIQREIGNQFVHWETDKQILTKVGDGKVDLSKRIYLNPKSEAAVEVFTSVMTYMNEVGISAQGKILDRSYELVQQMKKEEAKPVRADEIVLYLQESDADTVLQQVLTMYENNPDLFTGRKTPKIPVQIAPGIAVGDEPLETGVSLTSHRASVITEAIMETRKRLGLQLGKKITSGQESLATTTFQTVFPEVAKKNATDPNNFAFNLVA